MHTRNTCLEPNCFGPLRLSRAYTSGYAHAVANSAGHASRRPLPATLLGPLVGVLITLTACQSSPGLPTVDDSQRRPVNQAAAIELQTCKQKPPHPSAARPPRLWPSPHRCWRARAAHSRPALQLPRHQRTEHPRGLRCSCSSTTKPPCRLTRKHAPRLWRPRKKPTQCTSVRARAATRTQGWMCRPQGVGPRPLQRCCESSGYRQQNFG